MLPEVLVVVINWDGKAHLQECLESVAKLDYTKEKLTVMVIDNCSRDGSKQVVSQYYPQYTLVENPENLGYAAAENQAVQLCRNLGAEYLWILNNDVILAEDSLSKLIHVAQSDESIAVASPTVFDYQEPDKIDSAGYRISLWTGRFHKVWLEVCVADVDSVQGCSAMMRASVFNSVGLFNAQFKAYFEESDLHMRIKKAGFRVVTVKDARVWHRKSASFNRVPLQRAYLLLRNLFLFELRNAQPRHLIVFIPYYFLVHLPVFVMKGGMFALRKIIRSLKG